MYVIDLSKVIFVDNLHKQNACRIFVGQIYNIFPPLVKTLEQIFYKK